MKQLLIGVAVLSSLAALAIGVMPSPVGALVRTRHASLHDAQDAEVGTVSFWPVSRDQVLVYVEIVAATPGFHGIHIHANDQALGCVAPSFTSVGAHFMGPGGGTHGHHAGDMPAVLVNEDGRGRLWFVTDRYGLGDIDGKAVILHAGADNYGNVPIGTDAASYTPNSPDATAQTQGTGNAGSRVACGVIRP